MDVADYVSTKPVVTLLSYCAILVPFVVFTLTTINRFDYDAKGEECMPQGVVDADHHWPSLDGPRSTPNIFPSGSDFALFPLLALHAVPRAILAGVVTRCLHNAVLEVDPPWRLPYLTLVFGHLVADTLATVCLSGITHLLNPEVPHYKSYIEFIGYSLIGMVFSCVILKMSGQGHGSLYRRLGLLLAAIVLAHGVHFSLALHAAHCEEQARVNCLFWQYLFLLCKLRFDFALISVIMDFLE